MSKRREDEYNNQDLCGVDKHLLPLLPINKGEHCFDCGCNNYYNNHWVYY